MILIQNFTNDFLMLISGSQQCITVQETRAEDKQLLNCTALVIFVWTHSVNDAGVNDNMKTRDAPLPILDWISG